MKQQFTAAIIISVAAFVLGGCSAVHYTIGLIPGMQNPAQKLVDDAYSAPNADVRRKAIVKLTKRYDGLREPFLAAYSEFAADPDPLIRSIAITALGNAGDERYLSVIAAALNDKDLLVRTDAAKIFASGKIIAPDGPPEDLYTIALGNDDENFRAQAITALSHYPGDKTDAALIRCLDEESFSLRLAARQALIKLYGADCGYDLAKWQQKIANNK